MKNLVKVPVLVGMHAGIVGTDQREIHIVEVPADMLVMHSHITEATVCNFASNTLELESIVAEHASMYGIYNDGEDTWLDESEDGEEERNEYLAEGWVEAIYDPEKHDMYRAGGGSFLEDSEVYEAYHEYCAQVCIKPKTAE